MKYMSLETAIVSTGFLGWIMNTTFAFYSHVHVYAAVIFKGIFHDTCIPDAYKIALSWMLFCRVVNHLAVGSKVNRPIKCI